jgi:hypothetical protein
MNLLLNGLIPMVVLVTLNLLVYLRLREFSNSVEASMRNQSFQQREVMLAKVSCLIVAGKKLLVNDQSLDLYPYIPVFILCHGIRWIPNIYELQQEASSKVRGNMNTWRRYNHIPCPGGPCVAPLGAVHHPLLPPPHCYQLISQLLYLLPQALQRSHLQRVSAARMAETCQGDRDILLTGGT